MKRKYAETRKERLTDWAMEVAVPKTMREHNARLMHWAMGLRYASAREMAILLFLCHIAGDDMCATVSIPRIMAKTNSHHKTAATAMNALIDGGYIALIDTRTEGRAKKVGSGGYPRSYHILANLEAPA